MEELALKEGGIDMKVDSEAVHIHIDCSMTYPKSNKIAIKNLTGKNSTLYS